MWSTSSWLLIIVAASLRRAAVWTSSVMRQNVRSYFWVQQDESFRIQNANYPPQQETRRASVFRVKPQRNTADSRPAFDSRPRPLNTGCSPAQVSGGGDQFTAAAFDGVLCSLYEGHSQAAATNHSFYLWLISWLVSCSSERSEVST